ncbi:histidine kinase [Pararobbsia alpina]|uniref:sensor histidine kinase n=1 Tax=Pararobbsia alpina TaxID=621374 RepID=UPI0039A61615
MSSMPPSNAKLFRMGSIGWLLAVYIVSSVLLFAMLYWATHSYLVHEVDERLIGEIAEFSPIGKAQAIADITALSHRDVASSRPYGVFDNQYRWLAGNIRTLPRAADKTPFDYVQSVDSGRDADPGHFRGIIVPTTSGLRIVVGHSMDEILGFDRTLVKMLCVGLALTILLSISCGIALTRMSNRRIRAVSATARDIMSGQLNRRLSVHNTHNDLDRLAEIVNRMLDEIERLVAEVRSVCAGIAHDLRTPMTHLRSGLERAYRRADNVDDYRAAVDEAIAQSDVVLGRFTALLRIAEVEAANRQARFVDIHLDEVIRDVVELYEPVGEARGLSVHVQAPVPVRMFGDIDLLFGAVENLLDNALKFTPEGGTITIGARIEDGSAVLFAADSGPGIRPSERQAVLRPFYRSSDRPSNTTSGHGLGLSLVAAIARVHHASVEILDNEPGCRIELRFAHR